MSKERKKRQNSFVLVGKSLEKLFDGSGRSSIMKKSFKAQVMSDEKIKKLQEKDWDTGTMKKLMPKKDERNQFKSIFQSLTNNKKRKSLNNENKLSVALTQSEAVLTEADEPDADGDDIKENENKENENENENENEIENKVEINENENEEKSIGLNYGSDVVLIDGRKGKIGYFGKTKFNHKGYWYGIILNDEFKGKHDGRVDGIQYFKSKFNKGVFVRKYKIQLQAS